MFDTHAHYNDDRFDEDREEVINGLKNQGVELALNSGADIESSISSVEMAKKYPFVYAAVGVHPHDVKDLKENDIQVIRNLAYNNNKVVAIGEIGLDYFYDNSPREVQKEWFDKQVKLALELDLPIIIHSRDASEDTYNIIKQNLHQNLRGVVHAYSQSVELAREYVKIGFYLGIGGVVTYKNAKTLVEVVGEIDIENLVIETDCPYLSPEPNRGKRNDSANLKYVVKKIAEIKSMSEEEVVRITTENGKKLFGIN